MIVWMFLCLLIICTKCFLPFLNWFKMYLDVTKMYYMMLILLSAYINIDNVRFKHMPVNFFVMTLNKWLSTFYLAAENTSWIAIPFFWLGCCCSYKDQATTNKNTTSRWYFLNIFLVGLKTFAIWPFIPSTHSCHVHVCSEQQQFFG